MFRSEMLFKHHAQDQPTYHIHDDHWVREIRVLFCILDGIGALDMASALQLHKRRVDWEKLVLLHVANTPAEDLRRVQLGEEGKRNKLCTCTHVCFHGRKIQEVTGSTQLVLVSKCRRMNW